MSSRSVLRALPLALVLAAAGAADAAVTSNVALTSDYVFRGVSQTNREPAIQGGFDVTTEGGAYFGTWGSSISWLSDYGGISSNVEIDAYGGYRGSFSDSVGYDIGAIYYWYPGSFPSGFNSADTAEIYFGVTAGIFGPSSTPTPSPTCSATPIRMARAISTVRSTGVSPTPGR